MRRMVHIGIVFVVIITIFALLVWRKNDGMSKVQRDIEESLERAKLLKTERDSLAKLEDQRRFAKKREEAGKIGETGKAGEAGKTAETGPSTHPPDVSSGQRKPSSGTDVVMDNANPSLVKTTLPPNEGASVPADRFFTTDAMDGLTPVGKKTEFKPGDIVYIYAGIHAPQAEQVRLDWIDTKGNLLPPPLYVNIESNTGSNGYRIYKNRKFQSVGKYTVRLYNGSGKMIGQTEFTVSD